MQKKNIVIQCNWYSQFTELTTQAYSKCKSYNIFFLFFYRKLRIIASFNSLYIAWIFREIFAKLFSHDRTREKKKKKENICKILRNETVIVLIINFTPWTMTNRFLHNSWEVARTGRVDIPQGEKLDGKVVASFSLFLIFKERSIESQRYDLRGERATFLRSIPIKISRSIIRFEGEKFK